jgi:formate-dependent phosphoribosylglycinamide formyltransferase (GAR transformylase)
MPFVIYATPNFTENAVRFIAILAGMADVQLGLITEEPLHLLDERIQSMLCIHRKVNNPLDSNELAGAAAEMQAEMGMPVHRLMGAVEIMQVPLALAREALGIEGMGYEVALNFRDKARMKALFREAGIPCARYAAVEDKASAYRFVATCGFPVVAKPPAGMGSLSTYRIDTPEMLAWVLEQLPPSKDHAVLLEEFITGTEHSFDTFSLGGRAVFSSVSHYFPNPIAVMEEPWIQWQVVVPREVDTLAYDDIREVGQRALAVLGMETGLSHLEWFRRPDGSIAVSEVAARPPGAQITTLISRASDFDALEAWARMVIFGAFVVPERKYAVGAAYLRGMGTGLVRAVHGLEQVEQQWGHLITDAKIPVVGSPAGSNYEGEGFIIIRHPDTDLVKTALRAIVSTVRVELQ